MRAMNNLYPSGFNRIQSHIATSFCCICDMKKSVAFVYPWACEGADHDARYR